MRLSPSLSDGMTGLLVACLANVAIAVTGLTSSATESQSVRPAVKDHSHMSMVRPRPIEPKPVRPTRKGFKSNSTLAPISEEKAYWRELYLKALAFQMWLDPMCRKCRERPATEGHHPFRQVGPMIMIFAPVCRECHEGTENNKNNARQEAWIRYK